MPISASERGRGTAGVTLLELLIVVAVVAVAAAAFGNLSPRGGGQASLAAAEEAVVALLRAARADAMAGGEARRVVIDTDGAAIADEGGGRRVALGRGTAVAVVHAREAATADEAAIIFFADGSSTGGAIALGIGERRSRIEVHWLTGQIDARTQ
jgi:general secretion pathway protein H